MTDIDANLFNLNVIREVDIQNLEVTEVSLEEGFIFAIKETRSLLSSSAIINGLWQ